VKSIEFVFLFNEGHRLNCLKSIQRLMGFKVMAKKNLMISTDIYYIYKQ